uniref:SAM-dependent methyltransferase n=1 Tax=Sphingomonas sp. TaxID=28214 RepID=UPI00286A23D3
MNANKALWEKGDFTRIADCMRQSGAELVDRIGIGAGEKVLDLGCGDGTTALPAAERGADVTGVDIAANLVAAGNRRAEAAGLSNIKFEEGDASSLESIEDGKFDRVVS